MVRHSWFLLNPLGISQACLLSLVSFQSSHWRCRLLPQESLMLFLFLFMMCLVLFQPMFPLLTLTSQPGFLLHFLFTPSTLLLITLRLVAKWLNLFTLFCLGISLTLPQQLGCLTLSSMRAPRLSIIVMSMVGWFLQPLLNQLLLLRALLCQFLQLRRLSRKPFSRRIRLALWNEILQSPRLISQSLLPKVVMVDVVEVFLVNLLALLLPLMIPHCSKLWTPYLVFT